MSARSSKSSGGVLPPLEFRGATPFGQMVALAARSALASLGVHRLRAALTMVGIVVGVAGVFAILNLAAFARAETTRGIGGLGANVIDVFGYAVSSTAPPPTGSDRVVVSVSGAPSLTVADIQSLQKLPHVVGVTPQTGNQLQVQAGNRNWSTQVIGAYPDIQVTQGYRAEQGGFFSQSDVASGATVAVLGQVVASELFPDGNAVGQRVRIGNVEFTVVGVLKLLGGTRQLEGAGGKLSMDDVAIVPVSTFSQRLMGSGVVRMAAGDVPKQSLPADADRIQARGVDNPALARTNFPILQVAVDDPGNVEAAKEAIARTLRQNHGIGADGQDDFTVGGFLQGIAAARQGATTIMWVMGAVAAIALLIGGFGVANVMLASVAERRTEIGVRLAVGARDREIFWQFLLESLTVSAVGGILGVGGGVALTMALPSLSAQFARMRAAPSWIDVGAALVAAIAIGLAFGAYPARRAAQTDPIRALRRG